MESPKTPEFINDAVNYFVEKYRAQFLEILSKLEVEEQIKVLARIGNLSGLIQQELQAAIEKKTETAPAIPAPSAPAAGNIPSQAEKHFAREKAELIAKISNPNCPFQQWQAVVRSVIQVENCSFASVALEVGISQSHLSNILNGRSIASSETRAKITEWAKAHLSK